MTVNDNKIMREDVTRFRKIYKNLIAAKTYTRKQVVDALKVSDPTLKRLLEANLDDEFHIRASVLGAVQDFNKAFNRYERIDIEPESEMRSDARRSRIQGQDQGPAPDPEGVLSHERERSLEDLIRELLTKFPKGTELNITFKALNI